MGSNGRSVRRRRRSVDVGGAGWLAGVALVGCNLILGNEEGTLESSAGSAGAPLDGGSGGSAGDVTGGGVAGEGGAPEAGAGGASPCEPGVGACPCPDGLVGEAGSGCVPEACRDCALARAESSCVDGACAIARCVGPFRDANGIAADGCESGDIARTGLTLWFMADRGVTSAGGLVSAWADSSGNGLHATQADTAAMPRSVTATAGPAMLEFDGAGDHLILPQGFASFSGTSFFAVVEASPTAGCAGILSFSTGPGKNDVEFGRHTSNLLYYEVVGDFVQGQSNGFVADRRLLVDIVQSADQSVELRVNRARTAAGSIPLPVNVARNQNFVGKNLYTVCEPGFRGRIGEIVFYARGVSVAERDLIGSYLVEKWAVPL